VVVIGLDRKRFENPFDSLNHPFFMRLIRRAFFAHVKIPVEN